MGAPRRPVRRRRGLGLHRDVRLPRRPAAARPGRRRARCTRRPLPPRRGCRPSGSSSTRTTALTGSSRHLRRPTGSPACSPTPASRPSLLDLRWLEFVDVAGLPGDRPLGRRAGDRGLPLEVLAAPPACSSGCGGSSPSTRSPPSPSPRCARDGVALQATDDTSRGFEHEALFYRDDDGLPRRTRAVRPTRASTSTRRSSSPCRAPGWTCSATPSATTPRGPVPRHGGDRPQPGADHRRLGRRADEATADGRTLRGVGEPAWSGGGSPSDRVPAARAAAQPRVRRRARRGVCSAPTTSRGCRGGVRPALEAHPIRSDLRRARSQRPVRPATATSSRSPPRWRGRARASCGASSAGRTTSRRPGRPSPSTRAPADFPRSRSRRSSSPPRSSRPTASATAEAAARSRCGCRTSAAVVEFTDSGQSTDPLTGRLTPSHEQEGGRGLFLVHQLCDLVQLRSSPEGTTVRVVTWL